MQPHTAQATNTRLDSVCASLRELVVWAENDALTAIMQDYK